MGIQDIIVIILIVGALLYTVLGIFKAFNQKTTNSCGCSSCDLKNNHKDLQTLINKKVRKEYS